MQKMSCAVCETLSRCILADLACNERQRIDQFIRHGSCVKGDIIFRQGEEISGCYILCRGKIQLARYTRQGNKQLANLLSGGDLFGELALWEAKASSMGARALAESTVGWLSPGDFQDLQRRLPSIALEIQKRLAQGIDELRVRLTEWVSCGVQERMIDLLLEMGQKYGHSGDRGLLIDLKLTESEFAEMLGTSREWICKQLGVLWRRGLVAYRRGELVILNETGLQQLTSPPRNRRTILRLWGS